MCNGRTRLLRSRSTIYAARVKRSCSIGAAQSVQCYRARRSPDVQQARRHCSAEICRLGRRFNFRSRWISMAAREFSSRRSACKTKRRSSRTGPTRDFEARFFPQIDRFARTVSTQNGRFRTTGEINRNRGRAAPATSVSRHRRFQIRFSGPNFCRFWTRIVTSNARLNTVCSS
jgi:hypothetical protein